MTKLAKQYLSMGEVCGKLGLRPSAVRFWEKHFADLKPDRSSGKHRYFSPKQVELLEYISALREEGLTIEGVKKRIAEDKRAKPLNRLSPAAEVLDIAFSLDEEELSAAPSQNDDLLAVIKEELLAIKQLLKGSG